MGVFGNKNKAPQAETISAEPQIRRTPRELQRMELERQRMIREQKRKSIPGTVFSWTFQILVVIMFAYVVVFFFGQSRTNVGQSMDPTLAGGDTVLINTLSYQLGGPSRGDLVSFKPNGSETSHANIKRVIGLPGETIQIIDGMIYIDGQVYLEQEHYPNITNPGMASDPVQLGATEYFVLGDNRNNSEDSRFADVGLVDSDMIEGRVWMVIQPAAHRKLL